MSLELRAAIVAEARSWISTPFHHQARLRNVGVDCCGLIIGVGWELGLFDRSFDVTGYPATPDGKTLLQHCDRWLARIPREQMKLGDVIVVRWAKDPQHIGLIGDYLHGGLSMIHAFSNPDGKGSVIEQRLDDSMLKRFVAAYRMPGVPA